MISADYEKSCWWKMSFPLNPMATHLLAISVSLFCICQSSFSEYNEKNNCLNLVEDCGAKVGSDIDNTFAFITCQNKLKSRNGGCITVPSGNYHVLDIPLNTSNIIYYILSSVTFFPYITNDQTSTPPIFNLGLTTQFVKNVSIIGVPTVPTNKFIIDLRNNSISPWNIRGIQCMGIDGFILANIEIKIASNLSNEKPAIAFDHNNVGNVIYHAKNGKVVNITSSDYIFGYGQIQIQSGENISFENLDGTGGVTLRLETGAGNGTGYANNIFGKNIICRNGHAAFIAVPHSQKNGFFNVSNLTSYSCDMGVNYGGTQDGYFMNGSIISEVVSYYGTNAQLNKNTDGPSCGVCKHGENVTYSVIVSGLESVDFPPPSNRSSCVYWDKYGDCVWNNNSFVY